MVILIAVLHILFVIGFAYITELMSMCSYNFFMEVLEYHERKTRAKDVVVPEITETETTTENVKLEKVEVEEEKKEEKSKKTTKKKD